MSVWVRGPTGLGSRSRYEQRRTSRRGFDEGCPASLADARGVGDEWLQSPIPHVSIDFVCTARYDGLNR